MTQPLVLPCSFTPLPNHSEERLIFTKVAPHNSDRTPLLYPSPIQPQNAGPPPFMITPLPNLLKERIIVTKRILTNDYNRPLPSSITLFPKPQQITPTPPPLNITPPQKERVIVPSHYPLSHTITHLQPHPFPFINNPYPSPLTLNEGPLLSFDRIINLFPLKCRKCLTY